MKRVAVLIETSLSSGRDILDGIGRFLHEHEDWSVFHHTGPLGAMSPSALRQWEGDGIIARLATPDMLRLIQSKGVPVVDVLGNVPESPFPLIKCDDHRIGEIGAEHLFEAGHRHFAFLGLGDERWSLERRVGFEGYLQSRAESCRTLLLDAPDRAASRLPRTVARVARFLADAPTPLGLMVASDQFGLLAVEACRLNHQSIPEEVALVSVDNDQPFCNLCRPRLSSIEANHHGVGYEAARLLDELMTTRRAASGAGQEVPPLTLHRRASSDSLAIADPALVRGLRFIRNHASEGISVDDVAREAGLSRSVLQRRFRDLLAGTVGDHLRRARLRRACDLLRFTTLPLLDVAERSGFNYQEYLTQVFQREMGVTPAKFRQQAQVRDGTLRGPETTPLRRD